VNRSECETGFTEAALGTNPTVSHNLSVSGAASLHVVARRAYLMRVGLDHSPVELQETLSIALSSPSSMSEWLEGKPVFKSAKVVEEDGVPPSFEIL